MSRRAPDAMGLMPKGNAQFPRLAGQLSDYIFDKLSIARSGGERISEPQRRVKCQQHKHKHDCASKHDELLSSYAWAAHRQLVTD